MLQDVTLPQDQKPDLHFASSSITKARLFVHSSYTSTNQCHCRKGLWTDAYNVARKLELDASI